MPLPPLQRRYSAPQPPQPKRLLEAAVTKQIKDFLEAKQWRPIRMQSGKFLNPAGQMMTVGQRGMADWFFVYYLEKVRKGLSVTLWIEMKREGNKNRCDCVARAQAGKSGPCTPCAQRDWRAREEGRGALFGPGDSIDTFMEFYRDVLGWLHDGHVAGQIDLFL